MNVVVAGAGYVGLTISVTLAYVGHDVACVDVDEGKIELLHSGKVPIFEPGLAAMLNLVRAGVRFTSCYRDAGVDQADVIFVSVGTPSLPNGTTDLRYVKAAAREIGRNLGPGLTVIVNKSTVPIGSGNLVNALVRDVFRTHNEDDPGDRYVVASSPEFLREGSALHDALYPDRIVVGAEDQRAVDVLSSLYRPILNQDFPAPEFLPRPYGLGAVPLVTTNLPSAELIKYAANCFLAVKIGYINEMAQLAERVGADVTQVARGMGLDSRIGPRFLRAGIGWGGSCFGKDSAALISTAEEYGLTSPIIQAAREINERQRRWVGERLLSELKTLKGRKIALLGLAFKPHTDDLRDAPALDIARRLLARGAQVSAHDPVALSRARREYPDLGVLYCDDALAAVREADALVLVTEWPEYRRLPWEKVKGLLRVPLLLDGRNFLPRHELERLGYRYVGVGR